MNDHRLHELIASLVDTWNRRDWPAFAGCFADQADYVTGEGDRWSGRHAIRQGMEDLFASGGTGGKASITRKTLRELQPGVAVAHLHWRLMDPAAEPGATALPRQGVSVFVLALHDDRWLIEAAQNTDSDPNHLLLSPPRS